MTMTSVFEAKCASCAAVFGLPSLGDMSYGSAIFTSADGKHHQVADAFSPFPQRLRSVLSRSNAATFWSILASFADQVENQPLFSSHVCPSCRSSNLESWEGSRLGEIDLAEATYSAAMRLSDAEIAQQVSSRERANEV
jgi:hypothetical protein